MLISDDQQASVVSVRWGDRECDRSPAFHDHRCLHDVPHDMPENPVGSEEAPPDPP